MNGEMNVDKAHSWLLEKLDGEPLVFSSADPEIVAKAQMKYGQEKLAHKIEAFFSDLAARARDSGVRRLVSAGGETSGAIVTGLACDALQVGPEIDPGVPMLRVDGQNLGIALKSGNFGSEDFFTKALKMLEGTSR